MPIERPHSSISLGSQNFDYSNQSAEDLFGTNPSTPGTPIDPNKISSSASDYPGSPGGQSIIQSVNPDGSKVVYHVTEIPDAQPKDLTNTIPASYNEDNVLQTPLVREQLLKEKNKQRRKQQNLIQSLNGQDQNAGRISGKLSKITSQQQQQQQQQQLTLQQQNQMQLQQQQLKAQQQQQQQQKLPHCPIQIKTEEDSCDPMQLLDIYIFNQNNQENSSSALSPMMQQQLAIQQQQHNQSVANTAQLISPNLSEDSRQSFMSNGTSSSNNVIVGNGDLTLPVVVPAVNGAGAGAGAGAGTGVGAGVGIGVGASLATTPVGLVASDSNAETQTNNNNNNIDNTMDLYSSDFIGNDIPNDIFEVLNEMILLEDLTAI